MANLNLNAKREMKSQPGANSSRRNHASFLQDAFKTVMLGHAFTEAIPQNLTAFEEALFREGLLGPFSLQIARNGHANQTFHQRMIRVSKENFVQWARYQDLLQQLHSSLSRDGLSVLLLKGAALRLTYEPEPGFRHVSDLDLFVPEGSHPSLRRLLGDLGFLPYLNDKSMSQRGGAIVDLHGPGLGLTEAAYGLDPVEMWRQSLPVPGFPCYRTLSLPHQLDYLSLHAIKHSMVRAIWMVDILQILKHRPDMAAGYLEKPAGQILLSCSRVWMGTHCPWPQQSDPWRRLTSLLMEDDWHPLGQLIACYLMPSWKARREFLGRTLWQAKTSGSPIRRITEWIRVVAKGVLKAAGGSTLPGQTESY